MSAKSDYRWFEEVDKNIENKNPKTEMIQQAILIFQGSCTKGIEFCL